MHNRYRRDNLVIEVIPEYKEEYWNGTKKLNKDVLHEKLCENKFQIERTHQVEAKHAGKDKTIAANFYSYKGE